MWSLFNVKVKTDKLLFLFQALHQERKTLTLSDARRALTFGSKCERSYMVNGVVHENKASERLNISKSDVAKIETKEFSHLMSPQKPVIIVHQACIDEKQECPQTETNSKDDSLTCVEFSDCSLECKDFDKENIHVDENKKLQLEKKIDKSQLKENETIKSEKLKDVNKVHNKDSNNLIKNECSKSPNLIPSCGDNEDASCKQECDLIIRKTVTSSVVMDSLCDKSGDVSSTKEQNLAKNNSFAVITKSKDIINSKIKDTGNSKVIEIKEMETKIHENIEAQQLCTEGMQGKNSSQKPGPTVYMNKVSEKGLSCWL